MTTYSSTPGTTSPKGLPDRFSGCLLGLAIGNAIWTIVEFQARGSYEPPTDVCDGGQFHLDPGELTDDTSIAMHIAESLLAIRNIDAGDQMSRIRPAGSELR